MSRILGLCLRDFAKYIRDRDPRIDGVFPNWTIYVKLRSLFFQGDLELEKSFRFMVVAGPFEKRHHQYADAVPFRPLIEGESVHRNTLTSLETGMLKDASRGGKTRVECVGLTVTEDLRHFTDLYRRGIMF